MRRRAEVTSVEALTSSSSCVSCLLGCWRRPAKRSCVEVPDGESDDCWMLVNRISRSFCLAASEARLAVSCALRNWLRALSQC